MKRKVLITGAAGFIGSNLAEHLHLKGFQVVGCDLYNYRNQFFDVGDTHHLRLQKLRCDRIHHFLNRHQIEYHSVDLADHDAVFNLFQRTQPDVVVHLAAQAGVRNSVKAPMDFVKSNLNGFANVLDACKKWDIKEFLYASSSSVYGARVDAPFDENDRCDEPESFYAATKMANELMARAYHAQYKTPSLGMRFFTVYGPWGRLDMAPILFADKIRRGQPIQLFAEGLLKRDFTYVNDTVYAIAQLIDLRAAQNRLDIVNVGHSNPIQVTDFVTTLSKSLDLHAKIEFAPMQVSDVPMTCANPSKLHSLIGKWPQTPLEVGLQNMTDWLKRWEKV
jgi:UDP-glucuronate 4-epimerase